MKKISVFFLFIAINHFSYPEVGTETNDLDLIILQNPKAELKKATKRGHLEKLIRIIRLIEQNKLDLNIFQDPVLVSKAEKREIKNEGNSNTYLFFKGLLWGGLIATALWPAGVSKDSVVFFDFGSGLDAYPLVIKGMFMTINLMFLKLMRDVKVVIQRDGRLVKQLIKKYHEKSLAS